MKLIHISDLHLGKRVNEFSMLEDQAYILNEILGITAEERPDGVLIAGDIYDKSVPSAEAVQLFDDFLVRLSKGGTPAFLISGNHDSAERLAFGGRLMNQSGIYVSPVYDGTVQSVTLKDAHGPVRVYLIPFLKPAHVRRFFPDAEIETYTDAMQTVVGALELDPAVRNVALAHQFVTGAVRSDSEEISVGGTDNVDAAVFDGFDYVALGHIHRPQRVTKETVRYCGTPLKYSFSEANHEKSVTVVELGAKGTVSVRTVGLKPLRDMRRIKGTYAQLTARSFYENTDYREAYMHITLTDEEDLPDAIGRLRSIYKNIMKLDYDNTRTRANMEISGAEDLEQKSPLDLLGELYEKQNNQPMAKEQADFAQKLIEEIWEGAL